MNAPRLYAAQVRPPMCPWCATDIPVLGRGFFFFFFFFWCLSPKPFFCAWVMPEVCTGDLPAVYLGCARCAGGEG